MPHTKLKRSDAKLEQSPKTRRRTNGSAQISGGTKFTSTSATTPASSERVVYTTYGPANHTELLDTNVWNFDADASERGYNILNGRIAIRRDDAPSVVREKERRNLARLLFQIAVLRAEREAIPLDRHAERSQNIHAEQNLIFTEAERWGMIGTTLSGNADAQLLQRKSLPRSSSDFTQAAVTAFVKSAIAIRVIGNYMDRIKNGQTQTKAADVITAAAESAENLAMSVCPSGNLRHLTHGFRALANEGLAIGGQVKTTVATSKPRTLTPAQATQARIQRATVKAR